MKWEYKTLSIKISHRKGLGTGPAAEISKEGEVELQKLGEQGWELVTVMPSDDGTIIGSSGTMFGLAFFKRQKDNT